MARTPKTAAPDASIDMDPPLTFTELRAEGFKRLKAVRIRPAGPGVLQITGKNDMGKTSVLDAFSVAVGGAAFAPKVPIKKGLNEAEVFVDLGSMRITRRWWFGGEAADELKSDVRIEYADGSRARKPQAVLDDLRGTDLVADPLAFMSLKPQEKFDTLKGLVPGIDFEATAATRKDLVETRAQAGRERDRAKGAADAIVVPQGTPLKLVSTSDLLQQVSEAVETNARLAKTRERKAEIVATVEQWRNEADALYVKARELESAANKMQTEIDEASKTPIPDDIDVSELMASIASAETVNESVRLLQQQDQHRAEFKSKVNEYESITALIDALDKKKTDAIAKAKLPVANMSFGDDELLMNGVPFEEASKANQIRACTAITMALKPKLKVILIRDGSLLDDDSMAVLAEMVERNGFVVLLERVAHGDERVGIVIEDGEVV